MNKNKRNRGQIGNWEETRPKQFNKNLYEDVLAHVVLALKKGEVHL